MKTNSRSQNNSLHLKRQKQPKRPNNSRDLGEITETPGRLRYESP
jgi:hypothetical protein